MQIIKISDFLSVLKTFTKILGKNYSPLGGHEMPSGGLLGLLPNSAGPVMRTDANCPHLSLLTMRKDE